MILTLYLSLFVSFYTIQSNLIPETLVVSLHSGQLVYPTLGGNCVFRDCLTRSDNVNIRVEVVYDDNQNTVRRGRMHVSLDETRARIDQSVTLRRPFGKKPLRINIFVDGFQVSYRASYTMFVYGKAIPLIVQPDRNTFPARLWIAILPICPGYGGPNCNIQCLQTADADCDELSGVYLCDNGRFGVACDQDVTPCSKNPCKNRGYCLPLGREFSCVCNSFYTGALCEIRRCTPDVCVQGVCVADTCHCKHNYIGVNCDTILTTGSFCGAYGKVVPSKDGKYFTCTCEAFAFGRFCENTCRQRCQGDSSCIPVGPTSHCQCRGNKVGLTCEFTQMRGCPVNYCLNGGTCQNGPDGTSSCRCPSLWTGSRCQDSACSPRSCYHGSCMVNVGCLCNTGYTGSKCDIPTAVNCDLCGEYGKCSVLGTHVGCACNSSIATGPFCEYKCEKQCENGVCTLKNALTFCRCNEGFSGETCNVASSILHCNINDCKNGGICSNEVGQARCRCNRFFEGLACEINQCLTTSCHFGVCLSGQGCICHSGYEGPSCNITSCPIDVNVCGNFGKCQVTGSTRHCVCDSSIATGERCEILCPVACSIRGKCGVQNGEVKCICDVGFGGLTCGPLSKNDLYTSLYVTMFVLAVLAFIAGIIMFAKVSIYREYSFMLALTNVMGIRPKTESTYASYGTQAEGGTYGNFASVVHKNPM